MKRLIFLFMFGIMNLVSFGQTWTATNYEADELTGSEEYVSYRYTVPGVGHFIYWSNKKDQFRIVSDKEIFNYESGYNKYSGNYCGFNIIVGLYDKNDKLLEKINMWLDCPSSDGKPTFGETRDKGAMLNPVGQAKKVKKILAHLQTQGYVRILTDLYGGGKFDLKINHQ